MTRPEIKQESRLTASDLVQHPVWLGIHNYDIGEPWYDETDEEAVRPWTGQLPFGESRGVAIIAATFTCADGSEHPGFCHVIREDWDRPQVSVDSGKGPERTPASWSEMHGGDTRSLLLLQSPTIFMGDKQFDFQLRVPELRKAQIRAFYDAFAKRPEETFPIQFRGRGGLARGITSGIIPGFFRFPLWDQGTEIIAGDSFLDGSVSKPEVGKHREPESRNETPLDSYLFIHKQKYFNKIRQL